MRLRVKPLKIKDMNKVTVDEKGIIRWYNEKNQLHREDGPAIIYADGDKEWFINDKLHREDGPAIIYADGDKFWYLNDKLHRKAGPAVVWSNGDKEWWLNGKELTEKKFNTRNNKPCMWGKKVIIDGIEYTLK
jgi:hypothetical protein